jgi:hypothetical protein
VSERSAAFGFAPMIALMSVSAAECPSGPGRAAGGSSFGLCKVPTVRAICPGAP